MMTNIPGIKWTPGEASSVNEFLNSDVGRKWLGVLMIRKPRLDLASTERAALSGAFSAGYESVFGVIAETRTAHTPTQNASIKSIDPEKD